MTRSGLGPFTLLLSSLFSAPLYAQQPPSWPAIPSDELALSTYPPSPGAHAVVLYRAEHSDDEKHTGTYLRRIKVLSEQGKKYSNIEIPFVKGGAEIRDLRARTVRPDGTTAEYNGPFFEKTLVKVRNVKILAKTFTLPDVQIGSIIEYTYTTKNDFLNRRWVLQEELPTRRASFSRKAGTGGFGIFRLTDRTFVFGGSLRWVAYNLPQNVAIQKDPKGNLSLDLTDIPPFQTEPFMPPKEEVTMHVDFFYGPRLPQDAFWRSYGKSFASEYEDFIAQRKDLDRAIAEIVGSGDSPQVRLVRLYARVQQIRNLSYERTKTEKEVKREGRKENKTAVDVLRNGYGSDLEINLLFLALARASGFDASLVLVGERDKTFFRPEVPDARQLNGHAVLVRPDSRNLFLDPGTPFCPFGLLPWEKTENSGVLVPQAGFEKTEKPQASKVPEKKPLVDIPLSPSASAVVQRRAHLHLLENGALAGDLEVSFTGQEALNRRLKAYDEDDIQRRKLLEDEIKGWLPADARVEIREVSNWESSEDPLSVKCGVTIPSLAVPMGRRTLLPLAVFHSGRGNPFQQTQRTHPVYFSFPFQEKDEIFIELSKTARIESLPEKHDETTPFSRFWTKVESNHGNIFFERHFALEGIFFQPAQITSVRNLYARVRAADAERIVLQSEENTVGPQNLGRAGPQAKQHHAAGAGQQLKPRAHFPRCQTPSFLHQCGR